MKEIVIHRYLKKRKTPHGKTFWHYELLEDKCTEYLAVYKCIETGHTESFQKKDFLGKNEYKERKPKHA